jgi:extracellular elastinolytic metalloproteinase
VFHDHLLAAPIGFTRAAGNFETRDGDPVQANDLDGANTDNGLPDGDHVDNANMSTPPDETSPTMRRGGGLRRRRLSRHDLVVA